MHNPDLPIKPVLLTLSAFLALTAFEPAAAAHSSIREVTAPMPVRHPAGGWTALPCDNSPGSDPVQSCTT